jgi:hypothetical protein
VVKRKYNRLLLLKSCESEHKPWRILNKHASASTDWVFGASARRTWHLHVSSQKLAKMGRTVLTMVDTALLMLAVAAINKESLLINCFPLGWCLINLPGKIRRRVPVLSGSLTLNQICYRMNVVCMQVTTLFRVKLALSYPNSILVAFTCGSWRFESSWRRLLLLSWPKESRWTLVGNFFY